MDSYNCCSFVDIITQLVHVLDTNIDKMTDIGVATKDIHVKTICIIG